ncbi:unnamed protein product [Eruca vesicaria subsp. sativa]|uniref:Uncharacterized protein n=1 Tax=Eruca vesicaria subsp. sativa TaxID=29727 RepID=A0ABC8JT79_ERUVS|nr:unnamed protein product [Eruca vesicaria subsp. sativa]
MADSVLEKATSALGAATETVTASVETPKTDVLKDAVENVVSRGIDGAKSMLHNLEEKKGEVSTKIVGAVSQFAGSAYSSATAAANRDFAVSADNQVGIKTTKENFKSDRLLCLFLLQL